MSLPTTIATWPSHTAWSLMGRPLGPFGAGPLALVTGEGPRGSVSSGGDGFGMLTASTPFGVSAGRVTSFRCFRVVNSGVLPGQRALSVSGSIPGSSAEKAQVRELIPGPGVVMSITPAGNWRWRSVDKVGFVDRKPVVDPA